MDLLEERGLRDSHRIDMPELVARKRIELRPSDKGKLFIEILEEIGDDIYAWLRK